MHVETAIFRPIQNPCRHEQAEGDCDYEVDRCRRLPAFECVDLVESQAELACYGFYGDYMMLLPVQTAVAGFITNLLGLFSILDQHTCPVYKQPLYRQCSPASAIEARAKLAVSRC